VGMLRSERRPVVITGPGRTKQSEMDACDVNKIVARFQRTGMVTHLAKGVPQFGDFSEVGDYRTALEHARSAEKYFMSLPAKVRARFDNDPLRYLEVLQRPDAAELLEEVSREVFPKERRKVVRTERTRVSDSGPSAPPAPSGAPPSA